MAIGMIPDQLDVLHMKEVNGVIRSLTRKVRIVGLESTTYDVLLRAYVQAGLPNPGEWLVGPPFAARPSHPLAMLVLSDREFKLGDDKHAVDVLLTYHHFMDSDNQTLGGLGTTQSPNEPGYPGWTVPFRVAAYGKNKSSVQQSKSNFYLTRTTGATAWNPQTFWLTGSIADFNGLYWRAVQDLFGSVTTPLPNPPGPTGSPLGKYWELVDESELPALLPASVRRQIQVGHIYPVKAGDTKSGKAFFQTGEITVMQPNENFKLHGQVYIRNPRAIRNRVLNAINAIPWMDGRAYEWKCTEVSWEPLYIEWQWKMSFEFQKNTDTWLPTAIFHDQQAGRPPANLVSGFGYRTIHTDRSMEINFDAFFGQYLGSIPLA